MLFDTLGLHPLLLEAVKKSGYETPTPVQAQAIPEALKGRDLMVSAATGSGKTAAFMLPALQKLTEPSTGSGKGPRVVVLTPTRELAMQVTQACEVYGSALKGLRTVSILGGVPYTHQQRLLRQFVDVMVATPGRLIDYMQRGMIDFSRVEMLVLDEADRMLDMGFIEDIEHIVSKMPVARQTVMFSATFGGNVGRVAQQWLRDPLPITVATQCDTHENIEQRLHYTRGYSNKISVLEHLLRDASVNQAIVFTATQREADTLSETLLDQGFVSGALHGGMNQRQRNRTLQQMKLGRLRVLVATDVAARGLDVQGISHVINFDLPKMAEDYVHRIGRTGRAGRQGVALTLADVSERRHIQRIERFTTQRIPVLGIEGLAPIPDEASLRMSRDDGSKRRGSGGGFSSRGGGGGGNSRFENRGGGGGRFEGRGDSGRGEGRSSFDSRGSYGAGAPRSTERGEYAGRSSSFGSDRAAPAGGGQQRDRAPFGGGDANRRSSGGYRGRDDRSFSAAPASGEGFSRGNEGHRPASRPRIDQQERFPASRPRQGEHKGAGGELGAAAAGGNADGRRRREWNHS